MGVNFLLSGVPPSDDEDDNGGDALGSRLASADLGAPNRRIRRALGVAVAGALVGAAEL